MRQCAHENLCALLALTRLRCRFGLPIPLPTLFEHLLAHEPFKDAELCPQMFEKALRLGCVEQPEAIGLIAESWIAATGYQHVSRQRVRLDRGVALSLRLACPRAQRSEE